MDTGFNHSGMTGKIKSAIAIAPSSVAIDLHRSANARSSLAFDPAFAVIGFSSGWGTIPS